MAFGLHESAALVHRGSRVTLRRTTLPRTGPAGGPPEPRDIVEAPDAVVVLPRLDDHRVVLIRNRRYAVHDTLWELPAGTLEPGEDPAAAAPRELREETGYAAERIEPLTSFYPAPGFCTERLHAFRATGLTEIGQDLDSTEQIEPVVVPWPETLAMVRDGRIADAKTIATLLYEHTYFRNGVV